MEVVAPKDNNPVVPRHSGFGIASFISAMVSLLLFLLAVIIGGIVNNRTPGGMDVTTPAAAFLGVIVLLAIILALVGAGLGITGLIVKNRKKVFAILGLVFNLVFILVIVVLMVFGLSRLGA